MKNFLISLMIIVSTIQVAYSDAFVPEFKTMKNLRCDYEEVLYESDGSILSKNKLFRIYKLDDPYQKIYDQKEPIDMVSYYGEDKILFCIRSVNDLSETFTTVEIDRTNGTFRSNSDITYDNLFFGERKSKAEGNCKFLE